MAELTPEPQLDAEIYRRSFEDSTDGIVLTDTRSHIVRANRAWLAMHGYQEHEVVGQKTSLVRSPLTTDAVYAHMWAQIGNPQVGFWKGELVNRRKDGADLPVLLTITPVREGERIAGYMAISIDQSERKQVEELKRLYELVVWHDLKSPVAAIQSLLGAVMGDLAGPLNPDQRDLVGRAKVQAGRMQELIATTLDLEKLKAKKLQLDLQEVELFAVVRSAFQTLGSAASALGLKLSLLAGVRPATESDRLALQLDPIHLQRCVDNLLKNAIEASPRGGEVAVRIAGAEADGVGARLSVRNGGKPIPADVRATLFHPFGTYGKRGGTGLGLYGVKLLVEAMGGTVGFVSDESGTEFALRFEAERE
ncbi:MAG TPA: PAS domain-containing sensor histidine kinase [Myxococcales bacterium]|jgi:PAS domain S-box-containing protein